MRLDGIHDCAISRFPERTEISYIPLADSQNPLCISGIVRQQLLYSVRQSIQCIRLYSYTHLIAQRELKRFNTQLHIIRVIDLRRCISQ